MCGGICRYERRRNHATGLSPRVRGNPAARLCVPVAHRSIPACAGEPLLRSGPRPTSMVYPRVCGGTNIRHCAICNCRGLSPRVRGNLGQIECAGQCARSIPACAGEPFAPGLRQARRSVYPRVCGGTSPVAGVRIGIPGLSPRVRGNRMAGMQLEILSRSIPACAGEPALASLQMRQTGVYPRVCGGTTRSRRASVAARGLSPRVRGNHCRRPDAEPTRRSIPACAGEPRQRAGARQDRQVYPRVCGGTVGIARDVIEREGLSPRVRGNQPDFAEQQTGARSIPACAGEPSA